MNFFQIDKEKPRLPDWSDEPQKIDMLVTYIDSVVTTDGINLAIARKVPKDEAVARGKDIAADITQLFELLMPLYKASVA